MAKVSVVADPECTDLFPHEFPAVLDVRLSDVRVERERIVANLGAPAGPL